MFSLRRKKKTNKLIFIGYLALGVSIILYQQFYPQSGDKLNMNLYSAVEPIVKVTEKPGLAVSNSLSGISDYIGAVKENRELVKENKKLQKSYKKALVLLAENQELRYLANMAEYLEYETISAPVYFDSSNLYANSLLVKLGTKDGVKPGFAALTAEGLVGRVVQVNDDYSRILLIDDYNASIPVRILETGVQGIIKGQNNPSFVTLITKEIGDIVKPGHHVVSSSVQGLFDDGVPVGIVKSVDEGEIKITPYVNLNRIHKILIIKR